MTLRLVRRRKIEGVFNSIYGFRSLSLFWKGEPIQGGKGSTLPFKGQVISSQVSA